MKQLTVIDTFGFLFRSFFALPPLKNSQGFPTGLLTGFATLIYNLTREEKSDYLLFALDAPGPSFRSEIDPAYKAQRPEVPEDLKAQLPVAIEWIEKMGFSNISIAGFEADDIIASVVHCAKEQQIKVRIVSHDKDLYQLIDDGRAVLFDPLKRVEIDEAACTHKYGVAPKQFIDYQALVGDSADNIPGVRGIGAKTAQKLLAQFDSLDRIYAKLDAVTPPRIQNLLREQKEAALRSRALVRLRSDALGNCNLHAFDRPAEEPLRNIAEELEKYELRQILSKIAASPTDTVQTTGTKKPKSAFTAICLDDPKRLLAIIDAIDAESIVAFDTETTSLDTKQAALVGFSFCVDAQTAYYVPVAHAYLGVGTQIDQATAKEALSRLLRKRLIGHNLKFDLGLLYRRYGFAPHTPHADTMLMAWLVDPEGAMGLDRLALRYFGHEMIAFKKTVKKGEDFSSVTIEEATRYAAEDAWMTRILYDKLLDMLDLQSAEHLMEEAQAIEFPLINVLIGMEHRGIAVDIEVLEALRHSTQKRLETLTHSIYEDAGEAFNINSTQQLAHILFEVLKLPASKKTKTGYSTNETVLEGLRGQHAIIEKLLQYRELHKLQSTYIEPLLKLSTKDPAHRIYTSFLQTGTATGRLSSKNPNLQNIPVKTEEGRRIREAFVAPKGHLLVGIDYSQIELRLLAHFSQDPVLVEAFMQDKDIHMETAVKLFGKQEAPAKRHIAKTVNFGLLYGMGSRKLSQTLGIPTTEAKTIIENYFNSFPTVKNYIQRIEEDARKEGYVTTLAGRRRYFDFEHANAMQSAAYAREAGNTVFQGSAADLIKKAMIDIDGAIARESLPAAILLQIHDELIFEVETSNAKALGRRFASMMQSIIPLNVPLKCSVNLAERWSDLK